MIGTYGNGVPLSPATAQFALDGHDLGQTECRACKEPGYPRECGCGGFVHFTRDGDDYDVSACDNCGIVTVGMRYTLVLG